METIGVKQLRDHMDQYLNKVRNGEKILLRNDSEEIAMISPLNKSKQEEKLKKLMESGLISWAGGKPKGIDVPPQNKDEGKTTSDIVIEDRR